MRRRVGVHKAATATAAAEPETHRLTDIEVKEVSVVDRPANRRKFLVVKRDQPVKELEPMKISPEAKTELQDKIKGILEAAGAVSKSLATAEATAGAPTPAELTAALETMGKLLGVGTTATVQDTEKAKPPKKKDDEVADDEEDAADDGDDEEAEGEGDEAKKKKAKDVAKAGKKMSRGRKDQLAAAVNALTALLAEVDDTQEQPVAKAVAKSDDSVTAALRELSEHVTVISKAVSKQRERLDSIAKSSGGSRQVSTEKSAAEAEVEREISWPMDMNKPRTRDNTPVEKSFF